MHSDRLHDDLSASLADRPNSLVDQTKRFSIKVLLLFKNILENINLQQNPQSGYQSLDQTLVWQRKLYASQNTIINRD